MTENGASERARILLGLGRPKEAEALVRRALASDPANPDHLVTLSRALLDQDRPSEAGAAASQALSTNPRNIDALSLLGAAQSSLQRHEDAVRTLHNALQIAPGVAGLHRQLGAILLDAGRPAEAAESLALARSIDPRDASTVALYAAALYNDHQWQASATATDEALALDPENPHAHRIRGMLALRRGGGRDAVEAHRQAVRLDPTDPRFREGLLLSLKTRNPLYGLLVRFSYWRNSLPRGARAGVVVAPYLAYRVLEPQWDHTWAKVAIGMVATVVILTWALEPLMNVVLLADSRTRPMVPAGMRWATAGCAAYLTAAVGCLAAVAAGASVRVLVLALGLAIWSMTAGRAYVVARRRRALTLGVHAFGAALATAAMVTSALGLPVASGLIAAVLLTGVAMTWYTSFA